MNAPTGQEVSLIEVNHNALGESDVLGKSEKLFSSLEEWTEWLEMEFFVYSKAVENKSKLKEGSEEYRVHQEICLKIYNDVKDKLLTQLRLSPSDDTIKLFLSACESLKDKTFPCEFVEVECRKVLSKLKEQCLARRAEVQVALGEDSLAS